MTVVQSKTALDVVIMSNTLFSAPKTTEPINDNGWLPLAGIPLLSWQMLIWDCCLFEYSSDLVCGEQICVYSWLLLARFGSSWNVSFLTFCLWSENGSGDWTSGSDCWSPCCRTTKTRMKRRRMNDGAVFSSSCSDCHPHCPSADPCWCRCMQVSNKRH